MIFLRKMCQNSFWPLNIGIKKAFCWKERKISFSKFGSKCKICKVAITLAAPGHCRKKSVWSSTSRSQLLRSITAIYCRQYHTQHLLLAMFENRLKQIPRKHFDWENPPFYDHFSSSYHFLSYLRPGVNFINIVRAPFSYESLCAAFFYLHVTREKLPKKILYEKGAPKTLMKLTPEVKHFCAAFANCL